jgi:hypothetical protein
VSGIEVTMKRKGDNLVATSEMFHQDVMNIPEDKEVFVTIRMARNPAQHRWFFGVLGQMVKAGVWDGDVDSLLEHIKIAVGHVSKVIHWTGEVYYSIKSIAFASMDQLKFSRFVKRAEYVIAERFGVDVAELFKRADEDSSPRDEGICAQRSGGAQGVEPAGVNGEGGRSSPRHAPPTNFNDPSWDRMTGMAWKLLNVKSRDSVDTTYEANKAEYESLVQIDRDAMAEIYAIAIKRANGDIERAAAEDFVNRRIDQHKQEMEARL